MHKLNQEWHDFIDDLAEHKFYGEITFFFQNGDIESSRTTERYSKSEVRERMTKKHRKVFLAPLPSKEAHPMVKCLKCNADIKCIPAREGTAIVDANKTGK